MIDKEEIIRTVQPRDDIICKTCKFKLPPVEVMGERMERHVFGACLAFEDKPDGILWKGEACELYSPEDNDQRME